MIRRCLSSVNLRLLKLTMKYKTWYNGKKFVFEGEGIKVMDVTVPALMQKIKRLKIGVEQCTESKKSTSKTKSKRQSAS